MYCSTKQRRYVRSVRNPRTVKSFYPSFKKWTNEMFPSGEIDWEIVKLDDQACQYNDDMTMPTSIDDDINDAVVANNHPHDHEIEEPQADNYLYTNSSPTCSGCAVSVYSSVLNIGCLF